MSKKIVIEGSNILESVSNDWGGTNDTESTQTIYGQDIPAGADWGVNREEVERFIKSKINEADAKVGIEKLVPSPDGTETRVAGFKNETSYYEWNSLGDSEKWEDVGLSYILFYYTLPSSEGIDVYNVGLTIESIPASVQLDTNISINIKGTSTVTYASGGTENISESLSVVIQTRTSTSDVWVSVGEISLESNNTDYTTIDLSNYLQSGMNYVRLQASGEYANSIWKSFSFNVVNLSLKSKNSFELPVSGDTLSLTYLIGGAVSKVLQFEFGIGLGNSFISQYSYLNNDPGCTRNIGYSTNTTTGISFVFDDSVMMNTLLAEGVHTVRTRLYVSDTVSTDWVENQYMVASGDTVYININNAATNVENWSNVKFFDWAAYCGGETSTQVVFKLMDENNATQYATWTYTAQNNTLYSLAVQLGIELEDDSITEFNTYMHIEDVDGNTLASAIPFAIANSADNQPTKGADFILQPSSRDNGEENPATIINAANDSEVSSSFSNFNFSTDGWMEVNKDVNDTSTTEKIRALHIPANRNLTIDYNPFSLFTSGDNTGNSTTLEIDFRVDNILDEDTPIIKIGNTATDSNIWGFEMLPTEAYLLTERVRVKNDQNVSWAEGIRTHLTINIVYNLLGLNLVRILINGNIEREFMYTTTDRFTSSGVSIKIGNDSSDIDIFGIRCLKKALSINEVMQDYKASLSTTSEKILFADNNNILGDDEQISWSKCLGKYNIIGHTGHLPKYGDENKGKTEGISLTIKIVGDSAHSGILTNLTGSGQGTTAMTYYDWNQQYKITDDTIFTADDGTITEAGTGYAIQEGEALAKKLVGKINFASGMQSHKIGLTKIYTDLYKKLVSNGVIEEPSQITLYPEARLSVYEKPFLFFHRESENDSWEFKYLMTFGAGKGDKPTFGFNKSTTPNLLMVEGANNDRPLALFHMPWDDSIEYDPDEEAWMYNGQKQLNFGLGKVSTVNNKEYPSSTEALNAMKNFFNFAYLHNSRIEYYNGTLTDLRNDTTVSYSKLIWTTQDDSILGSSRYDLFRYDDVEADWVPAGLNKETLNIRTQYESFCSNISATVEDWEVGYWDTINTTAINMRRTHFKSILVSDNSCVHIDDALYHSCFIKFYGATDNRAKNTYYYTDPETLKIRFWQDDLDTTIKTNNVGQQRKPYYVEEHDINSAGDYYWQGEDSGFYNLLEEAFETEMTSMMNNMMGSMASLSSSVMEFHKDYLFYTQDYFPEIAYNEQARVVYENAAIAQEAGTYKNDSVQAISQSCGKQRWSEYQWIKDRIMYISSWCEYGEFAGSSTASNGMSWRGKSGYTYNFVLTPAKWLYPRIGSDSGNYPAQTGNKRVRVPAGSSIEYAPITLSSDSWISVRGIDYYLDLGDMNVGLSSEQGTFSFSGKRLQSITVNPEGEDENVFLANSVTISNAVNIKEFILRNVGSIAGAIDLSKCTRLEKVDFRDTPCTIIEWDNNTSLQTVYLPSTLTEFTLNSASNLEEMIFQGTDQITSLECVESNQYSAEEIINLIN